MHALLSFALLLVAQVQANRLKGPFRYLQRDDTYGNSAAAYTNTSTNTITSSTQSTDTTPLISTAIPTLASNTTWIDSTLTTATCAGSVTYSGSIPPTVYLTVTEGFDVTVTASNASITETPTLITPLPACDATIMPLVASAAPVATIASSESLAALASDTWPPSSDLSSTVPANASAVIPSESAKSNPPPNVTPQIGPSESPEASQTKNPAVPPEASSAQIGESQSAAPVITPTVVASSIYSSAPYTSTVIVTKKTPVPVVVSPTSPAPVFQVPTTSPSTETGSPNQNNGNSNSPGGGDATTRGATANGNGNSPGPSSNPGEGGNPAPSTNTNGAIDNPAPAPKTINDGGLILTVSGSTTALGNIIASIINSPFVPASPTPRVAVPATTTIDNVGVTVGPSSIAIGGQLLAIPTSAETTVLAAGVTFTVRQSEIIAPGTTVALLPDINQGVSTINPTPTRITAAPGLVVVVGGSTAVIKGTTYKIGSGASPTTVVVSGETISLGPHGVGLPSTTIAAGVVSGSPMVVETAAGLTFSVDGTAAVLRGTTYRIGSGALTMTTVVDGRTISIGPGGIGLGTTTLKPTTASSRTNAGTGSRSTGAGASATESAGLQNLGAHDMAKIPVTEMLGWLLVTFAATRLMT